MVFPHLRSPCHHWFLSTSTHQLDDPNRDSMRHQDTMIVHKPQQVSEPGFFCSWIHRLPSCPFSPPFWCLQKLLRRYASWLNGTRTTRDDTEKKNLRISRWPKKDWLSTCGTRLGLETSSKIYLIGSRQRRFLLVVAPSLKHVKQVK